MLKNMTNYSLNTTGVVGPYVSKEQIGANPSIMSGLNQSGQFTIPVAKIQAQGGIL